VGAGVAQSVLPLGHGLEGSGFEPQYGVDLFPKSIHTNSGAPTASYLTGSGVLCPVVKRPECEVNHSIHLVPRLRMSGAVPLTSLLHGAESFPRS
jgi:hypothetical protein